MNKLNLETPLGNSEIIIQEDGIELFRDLIKERYPDSRLIFITDTNVGDLYRDKIEKTFPNSYILAVYPGDNSKRIEVVKQIVGELMDQEISRNDIVVGFGGGMITDLAGFIASIYMRGIKFIAIPTSLLAMTDAVIGGKTGINMEVKNILGTFYPAKMIFIDISFLKTLPDREFQSGLAETIKHAVTLDASLIDDLMQEEIDIETIIIKSIKAKISLINKDPMESGLRKVLNFGHTFGHAIESNSDYDVHHGEAISMGMTFSNKIAQKLGKQNPETGKKIEELLRKFKLPCEIPNGFDANDLIEFIKKDKKRNGDKITFIISTDIGKYEMVELSPEELVELMK